MATSRTTTIPPVTLWRQRDTMLPHWGPLRRKLHGWCKRSRIVNACVAAIEMRLGREELLSLPQYVAICPTGQCNASCEFCSVTINRSGIIKRQLPFDRIKQFLEPMRNTVWGYGLEGNGEPTLYDEFEGLIDLISAEGVQFYLITNGERLNPERIERLVRNGASNINISLNACTAETHQKIMKLKRFDKVVDNIRLLTTCAKNCPTTVTVSFVVNHYNIHETLDFVRFADRELEVDEIFLRPLSEIANDDGTVEDFRDLVPYESDVRDMIERVRDMIAREPPRALLHFDADTFKAYRQDPPDRVIKPLGFERRLLLPRAEGWLTETSDVVLRWDSDQLELASDGDGMLLRTVEVPVDPSTVETLRMRALVRRGTLSLTLTDAANAVLESRSIEATSPDSWQIVEFAIDPAGSETVRFAIGCEAGGVDAAIDFDRLRVPPPLPGAMLQLPAPRRWEVASPGVQSRWHGAALRLGWSGPAGPYLVKSYSVPCRRGERVRWPIGVKVHEGGLGIGVLDATLTTWLQTYDYRVGSHEPVLEIETGDNHRIQVVLYATCNGDLDAEIDWRDVIQVETDAPLPEVPSVPLGAASPRRRVAATLLDGLTSAWRRVQGRPVYCHKPWTDLHNFSVDGRLDVCCIATGASQPHFALGNLFSDNFQQVWNGQSAREFRRTVNSSEPLPPCRRCPMAYSYQGVVFDPVAAKTLVRTLLTRAGGRWDATRAIARAIGMALYAPAHLMLFRRFRKPT